MSSSRVTEVSSAELRRRFPEPTVATTEEDASNKCGYCVAGALYLYLTNVDVQSALFDQRFPNEDDLSYDVVTFMGWNWDDFANLPPVELGNQHVSATPELRLRRSLRHINNLNDERHFEAAWQELDELIVFLRMVEKAFAAQQQQ